MSPLRDLNDFGALFRDLDTAGIEYAVIGGCAVSAYARQNGEAIFSRDLDLYVTPQALDDLLAWAAAAGLTLVKRPPRVRALQVAVLEWRGLEINALSETRGLPDPATVARTSREVLLRQHDVVVPIADPFDLLANKLAVNREKDQPHIAVLRRFVEAEVVATFGSDDRPRHRIAAARRLLDVLGTPTLPAELAERLLPLADDAVTLRFLVTRAPAEMASRVADRAADPTLRAELTQLARLRNA